MYAPGILEQQPRLGLESASLHQLARIDADVGLGEGVEDLLEPLHDRGVAGDEQRAVGLKGGADRPDDAIAVAGPNPRIAGNRPALAPHRLENAFGAAKIGGVEFVEQPRDDAGEVAGARSQLDDPESAGSVLQPDKRIGRDDWVSIRSASPAPTTGDWRVNRDNKDRVMAFAGTRVKTRPRQDPGMLARSPFLSQSG